jgi:hypothetical protein
MLPPYRPKLQQKQVCCLAKPQAQAILEPWPAATLQPRKQQQPALLLLLKLQSPFTAAAALTDPLSPAALQQQLLTTGVGRATAHSGATACLQAQPQQAQMQKHQQHQQHQQQALTLLGKRY